MKKRLLAITILSVICLAGCSKKEHTLYTTDGVIYNDSKQVNVAEHSGNTAKSILPGVGYEINYCYHQGFENCPNNQAGVVEVDCTEFDKKKNISYFSMYLGSQWVMHRKDGDGYICGYLVGEAEMESNLVLTQMAKEIENLELEPTYTKAVMDDCVIVSNFNEVRVRPNQIVMPGILSVSKDQVKTDKTAQVGDVTVGFTSSERYDYYQWNEYVVKAQKGYDISECVTFKPKK